MSMDDGSQTDVRRGWMQVVDSSNFFSPNISKDYKKNKLTGAGEGM
jgi:hypothetical protein